MSQSPPHLTSWRTSASAMKRLGAIRGLRAAAGLIMFILLIVAWYLNHKNYLTADALVVFLEKHRISAPIFFVLIHTLFAAFFIPCSPLAVIAGIIWGQFYGMLFATLGALSASGFTFMVGRYLAAGYIESRLNSPSLTWLLKQANKHGWKVVAFTQMNPIFPSSTLGYLYGTTRIPFKTYIMATLLFMMPLQIVLVSIGQSTRDVLIFDTPENILLPAILMAVSFVAFFMLKPLTRRLVQGMERRKNG